MNFEVTSKVKCVTNELAIVEDEMKLDVVLATQDCWHLKFNQCFLWTCMDIGWAFMDIQ